MNSKVQFGISFGSSTPLLRRDDTRKFVDLVKMADDYGAAALGTFDTAFIGGDAYVRATLIAEASTRARVGLRPTNPLTREPQIMAAFLAQIDALTDGRAFMDIASGDSAVFNIGLKAASRARIEDYVACIRGLMAEGYGAAAIGTYDSAFLGGDAYVRATLMAMASSRAAIGLRPSNPLTREPQIMASFLASLDSLSGGRAFLDVASGDSAVFNIGYPAASRARIEDYVTCVRDLLARGEATYQGRAQRVRWAKSAVRARIPISICAEGPRMLHLGGRIGEGVIAGTGLLPEVIQDTVARIHAGARDAGRDPAGVEIWFTTRTALDTDRDTAVERVKASVSSILNHSMRFGLDGKLVPDALREKVQKYVDGYVLYDHVLQGGEHNR